MQITAPETETTDRFVHILDQTQEWAIKSALAANRPLLIRGEPGIGKTQLARAAAIHLKRPLVSLTVDSSTESRELMWTFDAVQRLAEAQVLSLTCKDETKLRDEIHVRNFVRPGPLWWAYNWIGAKAQLAEGDEPVEQPDDWNEETGGVVVLIDEIDKAESDVPNGLLEALGSRQFKPLGWTSHVSLSAETAAPLIVITTNEERVLPNAFVRRCFVLRLELPDALNDQGATELKKLLIERGRAHFPEASDDILTDAADLLITDRQQALKTQQQPLPGQAEYLDFLRAVMRLVEKGEDSTEIFKNIRSFVFAKSQGRRT